MSTDDPTGQDDSAGQQDTVSIELFSDEGGGEETPQLPPVPPRPADGDLKDAWVDYVVALGADRTFVTTNTEHHDDEAGKQITLPALTKADLIALADRLGG